jgi:hypothetical protein
MFELWHRDFIERLGTEDRPQLASTRALRCGTA